MARITPACAGKSVRKKWKSSKRKDHPRLCGEKFKLLDEELTNIGSPPPVRGKVNTTTNHRTESRITPACAGKSSGGSTYVISLKDHPRLCGEKLLVSSKISPLLGSPPPVRGKVGSCAAQMQGVRITPACAGKRLKELMERWNNEDHPRLCGEKRGACNHNKVIMGSPPPVRGKVDNIPEDERLNRITPACAGKSRSRYRTLNGVQDHPRLCGEKFAMCQFVPVEIGSPPPVRGKAQ